MSETIDVEATEVYETRSGWQAEDQIAVEYLEHVRKQSHLMRPLQTSNLIQSTKLF